VEIISGTKSVQKQTSDLDSATRQASRGQVGKQRSPRLLSAANCSIVVDQNQQQQRGQTGHERPKLSLREQSPTGRPQARGTVAREAPPFRLESGQNEAPIGPPKGPARPTDRHEEKEKAAWQLGTLEGPEVAEVGLEGVGVASGRVGRFGDEYLNVNKGANCNDSNNDNCPHGWPEVGGQKSHVGGPGSLEQAGADRDRDKGAFGGPARSRGDDNEFGLGAEGQKWGEELASGAPSLEGKGGAQVGPPEEQERGVVGRHAASRRNKRSAGDNEHSLGPDWSPGSSERWRQPSSASEDRPSEGQREAAATLATNWADLEERLLYLNIMSSNSFNGTDLLVPVSEEQELEEEREEREEEQQLALVPEQEDEDEQELGAELERELDRAQLGPSPLRDTIGGRPEAEAEAEGGQLGGNVAANVVANGAGPLGGQPGSGGESVAAKSAQLDGRRARLGPDLVSGALVPLGLTAASQLEGQKERHSEGKKPLARLGQSSGLNPGQPAEMARQTNRRPPNPSVSLTDWGPKQTSNKPAQLAYHQSPSVLQNPAQKVQAVESKGPQASWGDSQSQLQSHGQLQGQLQGLSQAHSQSQPLKEAQTKSELRSELQFQLESRSTLDGPAAKSAAKPMQMSPLLASNDRPKPPAGGSSAPMDQSGNLATRQPAARRPIETLPVGGENQTEVAAGWGFQSERGAMAQLDGGPLSVGSQSGQRQGGASSLERQQGGAAAHNNDDHPNALPLDSGETAAGAGIKQKQKKRQKQQAKAAEAEAAAAAVEFNDNKLMMLRLDDMVSKSSEPFWLQMGSVSPESSKLQGSHAFALNPFSSASSSRPAPNWPSLAPSSPLAAHNNASSSFSSSSSSLPLSTSSGGFSAETGSVWKQPHQTLSPNRSSNSRQQPQAELQLAMRSFPLEPLAFGPKLMHVKQVQGASSSPVASEQQFGASLGGPQQREQREQREQIAVGGGPQSFGGKLEEASGNQSAAESFGVTVAPASMNAELDFPLAEVKLSYEDDYGGPEAASESSFPETVDDESGPSVGGRDWADNKAGDEGQTARDTGGGQTGDEVDAYLEGDDRGTSPGGQISTNSALDSVADDNNDNNNYNYTSGNGGDKHGEATGASESDTNVITTTVAPYDNLTTIDPLTGATIDTITGLELDPETKTPFSRLQTITIAILIGLCVLSTVLGNILVLLSFVYDPTIRQPSNYFICSLALSDLSIGIVSMPFFAIYVLRGWRWTLGPFWCDIWLATDHTLCLVCIYTVLLITVDRFFSIRAPTKYREWRTKKKVIIMVIVTWVVPFGIFFGTIMSWDWLNGGRDLKEYECAVPFLKNPVFSTSLILFYFYSTLAIMFVLYAGIYRTARDLAKKSELKQKRMQLMMSMQQQQAEIIARYMGEGGQENGTVSRTGSKADGGRATKHASNLALSHRNQLRADAAAHQGALGAPDGKGQRSTLQTTGGLGPAGRNSDSGATRTSTTQESHEDEGRPHESRGQARGQTGERRPGDQYRTNLMLMEGRAPAGKQTAQLGANRKGAQTDLELGGRRGRMYEGPEEEELQSGGSRSSSPSFESDDDSPVGGASYSGVPAASVAQSARSFGGGAAAGKKAARQQQSRALIAQFRASKNADEGAPATSSAGARGLFSKSSLAASGGANRARAGPASPASIKRAKTSSEAVLARANRSALDASLAPARRCQQPLIPRSPIISQNEFRDFILATGSGQPSRQAPAGSAASGRAAAAEQQPKETSSRKDGQPDDEPKSGEAKTSNDSAISLAGPARATASSTNAASTAGSGAGSAGSTGGAPCAPPTSSAATPAGKKPPVTPKEAPRPPRVQHTYTCPCGQVINQEEPLGRRQAEPKSVARGPSNKQQAHGGDAQCGRALAACRNEPAQRQRLSAACSSPARRTLQGAHPAGSLPVGAAKSAASSDDQLERLARKLDANHRSVASFSSDTSSLASSDEELARCPARRTGGRPAGLRRHSCQAMRMDSLAGSLGDASGSLGANGSSSSSSEPDGERVRGRRREGAAENDYDCDDDEDEDEDEEDFSNTRRSHCAACCSLCSSTLLYDDDEDEDDDEDDEVEVDQDADGHDHQDRQRNHHAPDELPQEKHRCLADAPGGTCEHAGEGGRGWPRSGGGRLGGEQESEVARGPGGGLGCRQSRSLVSLAASGPADALGGEAEVRAGPHGGGRGVRDARRPGARRASAAAQQGAQEHALGCGRLAGGRGLRESPRLNLGAAAAGTLSPSEGRSSGQERQFSGDDERELGSEGGSEREMVASHSSEAKNPAKLESTTIDFGSLTGAASSSLGARLSGPNDESGPLEQSSNVATQNSEGTCSPSSSGRAVTAAARQQQRQGGAKTQEAEPDLSKCSDGAGLMVTSLLASAGLKTASQAASLSTLKSKLKSATGELLVGAGGPLKLASPSSNEETNNKLASGGKQFTSSQETQANIVNTNELNVHHQQSLSQANQSSSWTSPLGRSGGMMVTRPRTGQRLKSKSENRARKALRTISFILGAFVLCWTPYHVLALVAGFCDGCINTHVFYFTYFLCYTNSPINPFCYALANAQFKRAFYRVLRCNLGRVLQQKSLVK